MSILSCPDNNRWSENLENHTITFWVMGISHSYQGSPLRPTHEALLGLDITKHEHSIELVLEPHNPIDPNAILVTLSLPRAQGKEILGWVPKEINEDIRRNFDKIKRGYISTIKRGKKDRIYTTVTISYKPIKIGKLGLSATMRANNLEL